MKEFIMKEWSNIEDIAGYKVVKNEHGFVGQIVDKNDKTVKFLGMEQDNIGFSYDEKTTEKIVKKNYEYLKNF